jgi:hypothetical protein
MNLLDMKYINVVQNAIYIILVSFACYITEYTDMKLNMLASAVMFVVYFMRPSVN